MKRTYNRAQPGKPNYKLLGYRYHFHLYCVTRPFYNTLDQNLPLILLKYYTNAMLRNMSLKEIKSWTICIMTQETNFHFLLRSNVQFHFLQCSSNSSRRLFWVYKDCLCFSRSRCHNLDGHNRLLSTHLCCLLRNHLYLFPYTTHFWCSKCNCLHKVLLHIFIMFK